MKIATRLITLVFALLSWLDATAAQDMFSTETVSVPLVMAATAEDLRNGFAAVIDGVPVYVKYDAPPAPGGTVAITPQGGSAPVVVGVLPQKKSDPVTVVLPVQIDDKILARGVTLRLVTPKGNPAEIKIAPKRVFISIPFNIPVTSEIHPDFADDGGVHLVVQVVPRITKKAQVDIDNTATDGLVADIKYEGIAYLKFKDLLNRTNRRDMDGTFFFGRETASRWTLITENIFEKFDRRTAAVQKNQKLGKNINSRWRIENLNEFSELRHGADFIMTSGKKSVRFGNVDRIVKDKTHLELGYGDEDMKLLTRFEGVEIKNPSSRLGAAATLDRFGYQLQASGGGESSYYELRAGNLKVRDLTDEGEIDDHFNFILSLASQIGRSKSAWNARGPVLSGESRMEVTGIGSKSWLKGNLDLDLAFDRTKVLSLRYNVDYIRLTGLPEDDHWEDIYFSVMRNRDYFNPRDPLARFDLDSIFVDLNLSREGKTIPYRRTVKAGIARIFTIMKYDIPVDLFIENTRRNVFTPGANISIRRYI